MESLIAEELKLRHQPVAILFTDEKPEGAARFKEHRWGCVMSMLAASARGFTALFDRKTTGCVGGQVGLCFGNGYQGRDMARFLSSGPRDDGREGLGYLESPEVARAYLEGIPYTDISESYVVLKPLRKVDPEREEPRLVVLLPNADQASALWVLANYDRPKGDGVIAPFASGCQSICLLPYAESKKRKPRAVLGGMDISARPYLDPDLLTFTVPWPLFLAMEDRVTGSFLERETWQKIRQRIPGPDGKE
ncbi:MAG: DUF169 domain-containing protein [Acidobacteriota bacterium]